MAVLHLGLAEGRARIGLERVAINLLDYSIPDASGYQAVDEPCVPGGPAAYASTLPLRSILGALTAEGIPAFISNSAGTYLCNQTLYATLHLVTTRGLRARVGFLHLPLLPAMVAASGLDQPSMAAATMLRAVEVMLEVIATTGAGERRESPSGQDRRQCDRRRARGDRARLTATKVDGLRGPRAGPGTPSGRARTTGDWPRRRPRRFPTGRLPRSRRRLRRRRARAHAHRTSGRRGSHGWDLLRARSQDSRRGRRRSRRR